MGRETYLADLYRQSVQALTQNRTEWMGLLSSVSKYYKMSFDKNVLIYVQRPDAGLLATKMGWEKQTGRYLKAGSKGIGVVDMNNPKATLAYYFDLADTEYKYLSSMKDYMTVLFRAFEGSETELAHAVQELCQTKENSQYAEVYLAANKTFHARFCSDEWELRNFLGGNHKMTEGEVSFDKDRCTKECLDVLTAYNMDHEGHPLIGALHYEKMEYDFRQGEVLHNLNGSDYSVLMVLNQNDLFLMALKSGQFLIAEGTRAYARYPKEGICSEDCIVRGIEWDRGIYLGNNLSEIDMDSIQKEYGINRNEVQEETGMDEEPEC